MSFCLRSSRTFGIVTIVVAAAAAQLCRRFSPGRHRCICNQGLPQTGVGRNDKPLHHQHSPDEARGARRLLETVRLDVQIGEAMAPMTEASCLPQNVISVIWCQQCKTAVLQNASRGIPQSLRITG